MTEKEKIIERLVHTQVHISMQHDFLNNYKRKTKKSSRLYSHAVKVFPGGVNHNIRYFEPYPFFVTGAKGRQLVEDRKSTRLNSSHANISYAVFCLKKKSL